METKKIEEQEKEILDFWSSNKIYEKRKKKNKRGKKFYLPDGPPYATGNIHLGTALNKISKDIIMRYKRLRGFDVFDRPGYDTHGVPIEFKVEKEIGSKCREDIEKFGIKNFVERCKEFATKYINVMNSEFINLGVWMNWENPYITLTDEYIEKIWETFKFADSKNLLYLGRYPVHVCPRCSTAVAFNEIEYVKQDDNSIYVKFPLIEKENTFLIIWTTTPWTLPANTGVMVHPDYLYQEIELSSGERWIIAKELVPKIMTLLEKGYTVKSEFFGREIKGLKYSNPLSKYLNLKLLNSYRVVLSARYVNLEEGTGLVHCAPGHGKEDYEVGKEEGLEILSPVNMEGFLTEEAGKYAGKRAREVDNEIIEDLEKDGFLILKQKYNHDYPVCWRCKTPLLMISIPQWFFKISEFREALLKYNEEVYWTPSWAKLRMKAWLESLSDWPVSRRRYWGTPLPIWICDKCQERKVVGSKKELESLSSKKLTSLHKPEIDEIEWNCKCGGTYRRVPDVLDVWFDSGVASWAILNEKEFNKHWPADLNIEGKDQIRGWWNSQLILSQIRWGRKPFNAIFMHGMVLDLGKRKMAKSLGNIVTPQEIIEKYGRDALRYYFAKLSRGEDISFNEKEFIEIKKILNVLINLNKFIDQIEKGKQKKALEDEWILSKFYSLLKEVNEAYESYRVYDAIQKIEDFLVFDFSRRYIKLIRERSSESFNTLLKVYIGLLKILSPIIPFLTEMIWQELRKKNLVKEESIHLSAWPKIEEKKINYLLEKEMEKARDITSEVLKERDFARIPLKQVLSSLTLEGFDIDKNLLDIIKREANVKKVLLIPSKEKKIILDKNISEELEAEGITNEIARCIQNLRKEKGLIKKDRILVKIIVEGKNSELIKKFVLNEKRRIGAEEIFFEEKKEIPTLYEGKSKEVAFKIGFVKI